MSKIYTQLVANILFPVHESLKGHHTVRCLKQLEQSQWKSLASVKKVQLERLKKLLLEASIHSPYYARLFQQHKIDVNHFDSIQTLANLPLLDKQLIKQHFDSIRYTKAKALIPYRTGGSSGEPLHFLVSKRRIAHDVAAKWRATRWWQVDIGDKELVVWGAGIECHKQSWVRQLRDFMLRSYLVPAKNLTQQEMDKIIRFIERYQPKMLFGYPSVLSYIATYAQQKNIPLNRLGILVAFVTSEVLDAAQKARIEKVFGCAVANGYGGRDAGFIAHSCPHGNMHITAEDIVVEIVDEQLRILPPGQMGEIVVTHLASTGFPFIRYRTGDMGIYDEQPCLCGRGLPLLREIEGRRSDLIYAMNGAVVHRAEIVRPITEFQKIERFQFVQKSLQQAVLKIKGARLLPHEQDKLITSLRALLGRAVELDIEYVTEIPFEHSGKYKFVISELHQS